MKLVAETLAISRSSLYYQARPRGSRADRSRDQEIILRRKAGLQLSPRGLVVVASSRAGGQR